MNSKQEELSHKGVVYLTFQVDKIVAVVGLAFDS